MEQSFYKGKVFNHEKTLDEYSNTPLFCGAEPGLIDTINKPFPKLYDIFTELKVLDWKATEFNHTRSASDFKTAPTAMKDAMLEAIAWQWETDSIAGRMLIAILHPFISSTEYWTGFVRIIDNENVHGETYSEIIRLSFDNPKKVVADIMEFKNSFKRAHELEKSLNDALQLSIKYQAGLIPMSYELFRDCVVKTVITVLIFERVQFMSSFAVTFSIGETGLFQSICKAVQKICQDELEIHSEWGKQTVRYLLQDDMGIKAINDLKESGWILQKLIDTCESEFEFADSVFRDGRSLPGLNAKLLKEEVLFFAGDINNFMNLGLENHYTIPSKNPLPVLANWMNINNVQAAPMEQDNGAYKIGAVENDIADDEIFDF